MTSSSISFWGWCVSLLKFSYWSKFHVNIMTGSGVSTIFVYKWLTRNLKIRNTHIWVLTNIWRLGRVRDTAFGKNVSNKKLLNTEKCQGYNFCRFWVIQEKPTWRGCGVWGVWVKSGSEIRLWIVPPKSLRKTPSRE